MIASPEPVGPASAARPHPPLCTVWWADPAWGDDLDLGALEAGERRRAERFRLADDRARSLVAALLVRAALAAHGAVSTPTDARIDRRCAHCGDATHGKPYLVGGGAEFSVAHAGDAVVVAVAADAPVGIDVETHSRAEHIPVSHITTPHERRALESSFGTSRERALVGLWTRKEAVLKALGWGLALDPVTLGVTVPPDPGRVVSWPDAVRAPAAMSLVDLAGAPPGHAASLAFFGHSQPRIEERSARSLLGLAADSEVVARHESPR